MFRNALISVSDKAGLVDFLKPFVKSGMRLVSTGGTYQHLKENGFSVVDISEQTGFPEVMGGRVKTLHPKVHMGLLSRLDNKEDEKILKDYGMEAFDLVVCNLYPFEKSVETGVAGQALIEKIDIGGPSILRGAAKNFSRMTVLCDPKDYSWVLEKSLSGSLVLEDRKRLAARVFAHTAAYDSLVAQSLGAGWGLEFSLGGHDSGVELRYGENPQQQAKWYRNLADLHGLHSSKVLQGKPLSYNNILDLEAAAGLVRELAGPSAVAVKHNNPCGVASQKSLLEALDLAIKSDPVSVFGGIVAVNEKIGASEASRLGDLFLECIVAPEFSTEALEIFAEKKNLRILEWKSILKTPSSFEIRGVSGGFLVQNSDQRGSPVESWKFLGEKPNERLLADLRFAEKVCASLKSNSIALVKDGQTVGLGMGQVNRVEAVQHAIDRMKAHHGDLQDVILASDAFFPFQDSIEKAAQAGVRWVLQPGGSVKDDVVIAKAKELGLQMILTGKRHFRH
jgi:phosphoribosylaminoimidazolecarboxamide formyltransferase/IMP cyclohydrolase